MIYKDYLNSKDWKQKKTTKEERKFGSKKRCAICASKEKLNIHHLNYKNLTDVEQKDLVILCNRCHFLAHKLYKEGKFHFKNTNPISRYVILKCAVKKELGITNTNMFK